jgi:hypothetical protein
MDCGQQLQGYGHNANFNQCIHDWYGTTDMKLMICTWCDATKPNPNFISIEQAEAALFFCILLQG